MFLIFLGIFLHSVTCLREPDSLKGYPDSDGPLDAGFLFIGGMILTGALIRHILRINHCPIPFGVFVIILACLWTTAAIYFRPFMDFTNFLYIDIIGLLLAYYPILILKSIFLLDVHAFYKSLHQILIISIPVCFVSLTGVGFLMSVAGYHWSPSYSILFGSVVTIIYPYEMVSRLKETGGHTHHIQTLLTGEATMRLIINIYIFSVTRRTLQSNEFPASSILMILKDVTLGPLLGAFLGFISAFLMRRTCTDFVNFTSVLIGMTVFSYHMAYALFRTGSSTIIFTVVMMARERQSIPMDTVKESVRVIKVVHHLLNLMIITLASIKFTVYIIPYLEGTDILLICLNYVLVNLGRFISFLLFAPILSRLGYGFTFTTMMVCAWGGLKSPVMLILCMAMFSYVESKFNRIFLMHTVTLYLLSQLINGALIPLVIKSAGLTKMSVPRQINMNSCMKRIRNKRDKVISILKMERFFSDANWTLLNVATEMRHPYTGMIQTDESELSSMGFRFGFCSDCKIKVECEPTRKEFKDMTREARMRVLKAKNVTYIRQYEMGMISNQIMKTLLQAVEVAMDSEKALIDAKELHKVFKKQDILRRCFRKWVYRVYRKQDENSLRMPRRLYRRLCFKMIAHKAFDIVIYILIVLNIIEIIVELLVPPKNLTGRLVYAAVNAFFLFVYFAECTIKIYGYSWIYVCRDGVKTYFKSAWNIIDFIVLWLMFAATGISIIDSFKTDFRKPSPYAWYFFVKFILVLRLLKLLRYLKVFIPGIVKYLDAQIDTHKAYAYSLAAGYVTGEKEVLEYLPHMIDNVKIKQDMRKRMEYDILEVTKLLAITQKDRPWVVTTVKTKLAIRTILNSMRETIEDLKISGWVDDVEYVQLMNAWYERAKFIAALQSVRPLSPKQFFYEISWMGGEELVIDYLFGNVTTKKYDPGDTVCREGKPSNAVYILITGLLKLSYHPRPEILNQLLSHGNLPVVDYVPPTKFHETVKDYIVPGNCFGLLSTLTGRAYNCSIRAETYSQVYVLSKSIIRQAIEMSSDPINGLECRIWRSIAIDIALTILMEVPAYQSLTPYQLKATLERSFMPQVSTFKIFEVTDMIEDMILIDGILANYDTRDLYVGPCYIPRTARRLALPKSDMMDLSTDVDVRLLIIPAKNVDEYDLMLLEAEVCEMIPTSPSKCLQHVIQERNDKLSKNKKRFRRHLRSLASTATATSSESGITKSFLSRASKMSSVAPAMARSKTGL